MTKTNKIKIPWNKGIPHTLETRKKISLAKTGKKRKPHSEETKRKIALALTGRKRQPPWNTGKSGYKTQPCSEERKKKISIANSGKNNGMFGKIPHNWLGEKASYYSKHAWVVRHFGHPQICEDCGKKGFLSKKRWNIEWSNNSNQYLRDISDYTGRCKKCHIKYDKKNGFWGKSPISAS